MSELTIDERTQLLDAMTTIAYVEFLLATAKRDGGKVIYIEAIEQALAPPPADTHQVVFPDRPRYLIRHPEGCTPETCEVEACARKTLTLSHYNPAVYECWIGADGWLCTRDTP